MWALEAQTRVSQRLFARLAAMPSTPYRAVTEIKAVSEYIILELISIKEKTEYLVGMLMRQVKRGLQSARQRTEFPPRPGDAKRSCSPQQAFDNGLSPLVILLAASAQRAAARGEDPREWAHRIVHGEWRKGERRTGAMIDILHRAMGTLHRRGPQPWPRTELDRPQERLEN